MKLLFLDFETFYSDDYSLSKMTPAEYILNPQFQVNGCAIKEGLDGVPFWLEGDDLPGYLQRLDTSNLLVCSHNFLFDGCILAWFYNFVPKLSCCTLSIARATINYKLTSLSLEAVAMNLQLGMKSKRALINAKGMGLREIKAAGIYDSYIEYAINDVELCASIFKKLVPSEFPLGELPILDMIMRMCTQPNFILDQTILHEHLHKVLTAKAAALEMVGCDAKAIRQDEVFANMLRACGVEPPRKISITTNLERYAFAKTDEDFLALEEHNDPKVQALVAARLGAKSTIEETRTQRFINISNLSWPVTSTGYPRAMPMPIKFSGAHTHRGGGDWKLNVQNMPRGGELRKSLRAPPGYRVVTVDSSQIEARLTAFLASQSNLVNSFAAGQDVYCNFASDIFGRNITKADKEERFIGKTAILGLGFGLGYSKFQARIKTDSKNQTGTMIDMPTELARSIVNRYRHTFYSIRDAWSNLNDNGINILANGGKMTFGPVVFEKGVIYMPGRLKMHYHNLRYEAPTDQRRGGWTFTFAGKTKFLFGGKILENIVQYLDRILVFDAALRIQARIAPYRLAQQAHDENCYVVREEHVDEVSKILMEEMTRRPEWGADLPLMAEIGIGDSYGEAK